jgi:hypothetical protein
MLSFEAASCTWAESRTLQMQQIDKSTKEIRMIFFVKLMRPLIKKEDR